jgi:hypothetical protein
MVEREYRFLSSHTPTLHQLQQFLQIWRQLVISMLVVVGEEDLLLVVGIMGHELVELLVLVVVRYDWRRRRWWSNKCSWFR